MAVNDVSIKFRNTSACESVTFAVRQESSVAIVGSSGSGKTSLLLVLAGLLRPASGDVTVLGKSLWGASRRARTSARRKHLGYVAQFSDLIPELTLLENVAMPLRLLGVPFTRAREISPHKMDQLGVARMSTRFPDEVSGGEMQRAAIARSLVHDPAVVLADEPTGALDEDNRNLVMHELLVAARTSGSAVVVVTHDAQLASAADSVLHMNDGRLSPPTK